MKYAPETEVEVLEEIQIDEDQVKLYALVIYNDDVNSFDFVIYTLITILDHSPEQAEQCTLVIHHKGKCAVKNGEFDELTPFRTALTDRGLSAEIVLR